MPRTKQTAKLEEEKAIKQEMKDPKVLYPEFSQHQGVWIVKYSGGGRLPQGLKGMYMTRTDCQRAIDLHNANS